jgi:hypothetical protein
MNTPTQPFQWTDDLVKKFANELFIDVMADDKVIAAFKSSHSSSGREGKPEKDYEILKFIDKYENLHARHHYHPDTFATMISEKTLKIHSVRRLSDGVEFSIGDVLDHGHYSGLVINPAIENIEKKDWGIYLQGDIGTSNFWEKDLRTAKKAPIPEEKPSVKHPIGIIPELLYRSERFNHLSEAIDNYEKANKNVPSEWRNELEELNTWLEDYHSKKKAKEKPVLFTTEDGVGIRGGETVWYVILDDLSMYSVSQWLALIHTVHQNKKYFSTEQAANEYVTMNKPCLSLSEIDTVLAKESRECGTSPKDSFRKAYHALKELTKTKIKGGEGI